LKAAILDDGAAIAEKFKNWQVHGASTATAEPWVKPNTEVGAVTSEHSRKSLRRLKIRSRYKRRMILTAYEFIWN